MQDLVLELSTWFRRAIWFLAFSAAILASPQLFIGAAVLAVIFETIFNVTNARQYWESVYAEKDGYDTGNIDLYNRLDKERFQDEEFPDYYDYSPYYSWSRKGQGDKENEEVVKDGYTKDWRYVLGLPPWFLKNENR